MVVENLILGVTLLTVGEGWVGRDTWLFNLDWSLVMCTPPLDLGTVTHGWHQADRLSPAGAMMPCAFMSSRSFLTSF